MPDLEIKAVLRAVTEKAILLRWHSQDIWFPRSQVVVSTLPAINGELSCVIPEWIALRNGMTKEGPVNQLKPADSREAAFVARIKALEAELLRSQADYKLSKDWLLPLLDCWSRREDVLLGVWR